MLFFSSALLLAASCLLVNAGSPIETVTTCEYNMPHRLSCESGVISVQTSLYGRANRTTCSEGKLSREIINTSCSLEGVIDELKIRCDGKKLCELLPETLVRSDPCRGTAKYLQTTYTCIPAIHRITCDHSLAHLQCAEGLVISVYGADYGRRDKTTCSSGRADIQLQNTACSNPTSKVAESCQGQNSCVIKVSNSVFENPCRGTYKYLEVAYTCQSPQGKS